MGVKHYLGMMSGTSADGVDAALVSFDENGHFTVIQTYFFGYPAELQCDINTLGQNNSATLEQPETKALHETLAHFYANIVSTVIADLDETVLRNLCIANHGQTVAHRPNQHPPESLQLGDPQLIADLTGLPVISQFRQADMAEGGQGAPLMPAFHKALIEQRPNKPDAASHSYFLNLGGIANLSLVPVNDDHPVIGFDTGPANTLMNQWIKYKSGDDYDANGNWASTGKVQKTLLTQLLQDAYFQLPYPKSTGPDYFNLAWLEKLAGENLDDYRAEDVQATLLELTAQTIAMALDQVGAENGTVCVCGGGAANPVLMSRLQERLPAFEITTTDAFGVPPDWVEAVGFAWLGWRFGENLTGNIPSVTGARRAVVLGQAFLPAN